MQKWKCACSFKLLVLGLASFKLCILNHHFGSALQVKHSITRWKLEVGDRVLKGILKLQFKSSYAALIKTGQARSATHRFQNQLFQQLEEMQKQPSAASAAFTTAFVEQAILLLILNSKNVSLLVSVFHEQCSPRSTKYSCPQSKAHFNWVTCPSHPSLWDLVHSHKQ